MVRYIFLDIDGVLNSRMTAELWRKLYPKDNPYGGFFLENDSITKKDVMWSENAFEYLRRIVARTGASIVISSTWRMSYSVQKFKEMFALYGWQDAPIVGKTPVLGGIRGKEIDSFLADNPCHAYLILDDDTDFTDVQKDGHFVWTNFDCGLSSNQVDKCVHILLNNPSEHLRAIQNEYVSIYQKKYHWSLEDKTRYNELFPIMKEFADGQDEDLENRFSNYEGFYREVYFASQAIKRRAHERVEKAWALANFFKQQKRFVPNSESVNPYVLYGRRVR